MPLLLTLQTGIQTATLECETDIGDVLKVTIVEASPANWHLHDKLQSSVYCLSSYLKLFEGALNTSIAQVWKRIGEDFELIESYPFRVNGRRAKILGKLFKIESSAFVLVAQAIFNNLPSIHLIQTDLVPRSFAVGLSLPFPQIVGFEAADTVAQLGSHLEDYHSSLRKEHLKKIKYYVRRYFRDFVDANVQILQRDDISQDIVHQVVELNRARMQVKGAQSGIDAAYEDRIFRIARESGLVILLKNGEKISAGSVIMCTSQDAYLWVIAHKEEFHKYSPGIVCLYLGVEFLISMGIRRYHFLWGDSEYKEQLGGEKITLNSYLILRSRLAIRFGLGDICAYEMRRLRTRVRRLLKPVDGALERLFGSRALIAKFFRRFILP